MTRDYATRRPAAKTRRRKGQSYFGLWLFTIFIFILFTLGLVYLGKSHHHIQKSEPLKENVNIGTVDVDQQKPKLQFDFATPQNSEAPLLTTEPEAAEHKAVGPQEIKYQLDVAQVKDYTTVDKLKAQLAMLGFEAMVVPIKDHNAYYYKVYVGFYDKQTALKKQQLLKQNKFSTTIKKAIVND